ncbi:MAG TPA: alpha/beta hydrolase [Pyrinomonadaceae bacterium]|jgi:pimeloyl-ACP methyl ester carboxylesterase
MTTEQQSGEPIFGHGYAQVGDVRLHYAECGAGERLVVLLHGFPECWYSWRRQLPALGAHFRVVAPDLRGYNLSDKPGCVADYRIERLVDDVLGLIRHCGARRAAVVGHDWGAAVAWAVAERHPEYVWKLAAMQVPPAAVWRANQTLQQAWRSWYMLFFQLPRLPEWWLSAHDYAQLAAGFKATARPGTFTESDIAVYKTAFRQRGERDAVSALTGALNYYRANFFRLFAAGGDWTPEAGGRVRVPTLFLYGERDQFVLPTTVNGVGAYIAAPYREVRFAHATHWLQQEQPAEVNAALLSFLQDE